MTLLVLAQKRTFLPRLSWGLEMPTERFVKLNQEGRITMLLFGAGASLAAAYLLAIFITFHFSFQVKQNTLLYEELSDETLRSEILLQKKTSELAQNYPSILESMERVSSIKYLTPESVAASRAPLRQ